MKLEKLKWIRTGCSLSTLPLLLFLLFYWLAGVPERYPITPPPRQNTLLLGHDRVLHWRPYPAPFHIYSERQLARDIVKALEPPKPKIWKIKPIREIMYDLDKAPGRHRVPE